MGVYSTLTISRKYALNKIKQLLDEATNDELAEALFALTQNNLLYNYTVVNHLCSTCNNEQVNRHGDVCLTCQKQFKKHGINYDRMG